MESYLKKRPQPTEIQTFLLFLSSTSTTQRVRRLPDQAPATQARPEYARRWLQFPGRRAGGQASASGSINGLAKAFVVIRPVILRIGLQN
jgi:hypothetical protein